MRSTASLEGSVAPTSCPAGSIAIVAARMIIPAATTIMATMDSWNPPTALRSPCKRLARLEAFMLSRVRNGSEHNPICGYS